MKRNADLLIKKVQKDSQGRIQNVQVGIDTISSVDGDVVLTKEQVISILKDGAKIKTIYATTDNKGTFNIGAVVEYYKETNGEEYLKTNANKTAKDNLDNLPTF